MTYDSRPESKGTTVVLPLSTKKKAARSASRNAALGFRRRYLGNDTGLLCYVYIYIYVYYIPDN